MIRPRWDALEPALRADVERLAGGRIVDARSCAGGFSPGFASRLTVANGERVFVKAIDARRWPHEVAAYRAEAAVAAALPAGVAAPRFHGAIDDERWIVLAFEDVDGTHPGDPWTPDALDRVLDATTTLGRADDATDRLDGLPRDVPRLGGWATLTVDRLAASDPWAAARLPRLVELEHAGLEAARGDSLVHGDLYPHNILLTPDRGRRRGTRRTRRLPGRRRPGHHAARAGTDRRGEASARPPSAGSATACEVVATSRTPTPAGTPSCRTTPHPSAQLG